MSTYGPLGRSVLIQHLEESILTKDGLTVAKYIEPNSSNAIIKRIKDALAKTESLVGDGTTTTAALIHDLWVAYVESNYEGSVYKLVEEIKLLEERLVEYLNDPDNQETDLLKVISTISNGDEAILSLFRGNNDILNKGEINISQGMDTKHTYYEGYRLMPNKFELQYESALPYEEKIVEVFLTDRFDINVLRGRKDSNILILTTSRLTKDDIVDLMSNPDYKLMVFYFPQLFADTVRKMLGVYGTYGNYSNIPKLIKTEHGTFLQTKSEDKSVLPYYHHFIELASEGLSYEELKYRVEDAIKASWIMKDGTMSRGAGQSYVEAGDNVEFTDNTRFIVDVLSKFDKYFEGLDASNVYDSTKVIITALTVALEVLKEFILIEYIVINE